MKYRIALGGIHIESTTFTSYVSGEKDFRMYREKDLLNQYSWVEEDVELIPLISARAIPGGVVSKEFYNKWLNEYLDLLSKAMKEKKLDGILLDIHGAMSVEGLDDAEGDLILKIRDVVGNECFISTTMDLHGNVSDLLFESSNLLTCYRTAPHIDVIETKKRALSNMLYVLDNNTKLIKAKVDVPILLPGEKTSTEVEPGKTLYAKLDEICKNKDIIDTSIWMGFPWADQPRCHSAIVITGTNEEVVKNEIAKLSKYYWDIRNEFLFVGPVDTVSNSVKEAINSNKVPFFISDTGDNPGAGGSGDLTILLHEFLNQETEKKVLFSSIYDKEVSNKLYQYNVNDIVRVSLGSKIDTTFSTPVNIEVEIIRFFTNDIAGNCVVVRYQNIDIIITEKRFQYGTLKAYNNAGIKSFDEYDIIVVKMGYLEPDLSKGANGWVMALSNGAVSQDLKNINYKKLKRPIYPLDDFDFELKIKIDKD